ncbi:DnaA/Hda family protein, partial [Saccharothrix hoggarensis]
MIVSKSYGRESEWASVLRFLSEPGGLLAIDGPPCSGKSLLLREAVAAARERGRDVLPVSGAELASAPLVAGTVIAVDDAHHDPAAVLALLPRLRDRRVTALLAWSGSRA